MKKKIKDALEDLANIIAPFDKNASKYFRNMKNRNPQDIANDNNLWGGSGSYMDQGLYGQSLEIQDIFQDAAINLGKAIIEAGATSSRMEMWINAFDAWVNKKNV